VRLNATVSVAGQKPISIKNVYAADRDTGLLVYPAVDVAEAFDLVWNSPFAPPPKIEVRVEAEVSAEPVEEAVESIHLDRARAKPGDTIEVAVRLRKRGGGMSIERFAVPVPYAWADGEIELLAAGVAEIEKMTQHLEGRLEPDTLSDIVKWLSARRMDGNLYLVATRAGTGMRSRVTVLPFLPPSVVATMSGVPGTDRRGRGIAWEERRQRPGTVSGMAPASIGILRR